MARLAVRQNGSCPADAQWYVCAAGGFKGCCSVDPCTTGFFFGGFCPCYQGWARDFDNFGSRACHIHSIYFLYIVIITYSYFFVRNQHRGSIICKEYIDSLKSFFHNDGHNHILNSKSGSCHDTLFDNINTLFPVHRYPSQPRNIPRPRHMAPHRSPNRGNSGRRSRPPPIHHPTSILCPACSKAKTPDI
ncbi:hypothetical protein ACMYSQ_007809 [Aspergillus niger]